MNSHGGLTYLGYERMYLRGDLEKASRAVSNGECGMLTSHLLSAAAGEGSAGGAAAAHLFGNAG